MYQTEEYECNFCCVALLYGYNFIQQSEDRQQVNRNKVFSFRKPIISSIKYRR